MATRTLDDLIAGARSAKRAYRDVQVTLDAAVAEQVEAIDLRIVQAEQDQVDITTAADAELTEANRDARLGDPRKVEIPAERDRKLAELDEHIGQLVAERDALTDGTLITLRFTQLPGQGWAEIIARHPARVDVSIDRAYGYNYHEVAKAAAAYHDPGPEPGTLGRSYAQRVIDADTPDAEPTLEDVTVAQWVGLFDVLTGHEFERIASTIWDLNDYGPQQRIAAAGKASRAGSGSASH